MIQTLVAFLELHWGLNNLQIKKVVSTISNPYLNFYNLVELGTTGDYNNIPVRQLSAMVPIDKNLFLSHEVLPRLRQGGGTFIAAYCDSLMFGSAALSQNLLFITPGIIFFGSGVTGGGRKGLKGGKTCGHSG